MTRLLPPEALHYLAVGFGDMLFYSGIRRKVVDKNLSIAFGQQLNPKDLKMLARKSYRNAAIVAFEFLLMQHIQPDQLHRYISIEGIDSLKEGLKEGNGAIVAGNHFGNWELITAALSQFGTPLVIFSGMQKNHRIDDAINKIRRKFGTLTIPKSKSAPFEMMKALKANKPLGMAGDLNVPHDNLFVDFFGKKAVVGQGLATFALKRKAPLFFIWNVRIAPLTYKGYMKRIHYQITGNRTADLQSLAQSLSDELQDKIIRHPDQYFWFNRRWKTRPPDDPEDVY